MLRWSLVTVLVLFCLLGSVAEPKELTDADIRQLLIAQSIRSYSGRCPCPYNTMRNGRRCGGNSAYSKPGGASPLCYPTDVSKDMIERYRARHPGESE